MLEPIHCTLWNGRVAARPLSFLGTERFDAYRDATQRAGAQYLKTERAQVCTLDRCAALCAALETAGFVVTLDAALQEACATHAATLEAESHAAVARCAALDVALAARGLHLYAHQRIGVACLADRRRWALFDDVGVGKTQQALCAAPPDAPVVVVCPASLKLNWRNEAQRWAPHFRARVGFGRHRWEWPLPGELLIVNYEMLPRCVTRNRQTSIDPSYGAARPGTVVIADEAHAFKGRSARTTAFRAVRDAVLAVEGRVWLLTGTPLLNRPPELWAVLQAANLHRDAFDSWATFCELFGAVQGRFGLEWKHGDPSPEIAQRLQRVSLYRRRDDVLDLPPLRRVAVEVPGKFPPDIRRLLDQVLTSLADQGIDLTAAADLVDLTKITGAAFDTLSKARAALATAKIPALLELLVEYETAQRPVVVFSAHRAPIDVLAKRAGWRIITGDTPITERQAAVEAFQAGTLAGLGCTIAAAGVGLTLTRAADAVFVDLAWTPAANTQAEGRLRRIGAAQSILIKRLVADHELDRQIERVLRAKQELIDATVEPSAVSGATAPVASAQTTAAALRTLAATATVRPAPAPPGPSVAPLSLRPPTTPPPSRHRPQTAREQWICESLQRLAASDPDYASERNDLGFNQADGRFGHSLAIQCANGLTVAQYAAAARLLRKYHRQVGVCPEETEQPA